MTKILFYIFSFIVINNIVFCQEMVYKSDNNKINQIVVDRNNYKFLKESDIINYVSGRGGNRKDNRTIIGVYDNFFQLETSGFSYKKQTIETYFFDLDREITLHTDNYKIFQKRKGVTKKFKTPHKLINDFVYDGFIDVGDSSKGIGTFINISKDTTRKYVGQFKGDMFHGQANFRFTVEGSDKESYLLVIEYDENKIVDGKYISYPGRVTNYDGIFDEISYENNIIKSSKTWDNETLVKEEYFKNGKISEQRIYFPNTNNIKSTRSNYNGAEEYDVKNYDINKVLKSKWRSKNGKIVGTRINYYSDGSIEEKVIHSKNGSYIETKYYEYGKFYIGDMQIQLESTLMIIGIIILFVIVYNNQRKIRGLKYKVIIKDGIFDYIDQTNTEELQTKPVEMMKSITANAVKPHFSLIIWMFIILLLFPMGWIFLVGMPYGALFVGSIGYFILIFPFLLLRKNAQKSFIEYDLDEKSKERYEEIVKSFEIIEKAENFGLFKINESVLLESESQMDLNKKSNTKYIESNVNYVFFGHGLFLPDYIYCYLNADKILPDSPIHCHILDYDRISAKYRKVPKKTENKLSDHELIETTWRHARKDGGRDKRYKENPTAYFVNEGRITFHRVFYEDISSIKLASNFMDTFNDISKYGGQKSNYIELEQVEKLEPKYQSKEKNVAYILMIISLSDEAGDFDISERYIFVFSAIFLYKICSLNDMMDKVKEMHNEVENDSLGYDLVYHPLLRGTLKHLSKTLPKKELLTIKTLAYDLASADGTIDDSEQEILDQIDEYFSLKNENEIFAPKFKEDVWKNVYYVLYNFHTQVLARCLEKNRKKAEELSSVVSNIEKKILYDNYDNNLERTFETEREVRDFLGKYIDDAGKKHKAGEISDEMILELGLVDQFYPTLKYLKNELKKSEKIKVIELLIFIHNAFEESFKPEKKIWIDFAKIWIGIKSEDMRTDDEINQTCIEELEEWNSIVTNNENLESSSPKESKPKKTISSEAELKKKLKKFKEMLDEGLITKEQYEAKSSELLGLD